MLPASRGTVCCTLLAPLFDSSVACDHVNHFILFLATLRILTVIVSFCTPISVLRINASLPPFCFLQLKPALYSRKQGRQTVDLKKRGNQERERRLKAGTQPTPSHCNALKQEFQWTADMESLISQTVSQILIDITCKKNAAETATTKDSLCCSDPHLV